MTSRIHALLWDNDGVLVDTERLYFLATRDVLATVGCVLDEARYRELFLQKGVGAWHLARESGCDESQIVELKRERSVRYSAMLRDRGQHLVLPGVALALKRLTERYRMAVVTTSAADHFELIHRSSELLHHFEFALTRDAYVRAKPDPEPYLLALERIGLPPEHCLVIEDSERGLQAAVAAGLRCWVIPSHFTRESPFVGAERVFSNVTVLADALIS